PNDRPGASRAWILVAERIRGIRAGEHAGIPVLIESLLLRKGSNGYRDGRDVVVGVPCVGSLNHRRQPAVIANDAGNLPSTDNLIQPAGTVTQEQLPLAEREFVKNIGIDVMPDIEIGRTAELFFVKNVLQRGALGA